MKYRKPTKKYTRNKRVQKTLKKPLIRNTKKVVVPKTLAITGIGFPKKMLMTHKYQDTITINLTGGVMANYRFSCNSLFDPNATSGGHQPLYFDQATLLYNHYHVIGSKITVSCLPGGTNVTPITIGINVNDDLNSIVGDVDYYAEQTQTYKWTKVVSQNAVYPTILNSKWSAKKLFGGSILANTELQGTASASPAEQSFFTIFCENMNKGPDTQSIICQVSIEYITMWTELRDVSQS